MAAPNEALVFRCGGYLWINPTSIAPPGYGGATRFGVTARSSLSPIVRQFNVTAEEYGGSVVEAVNMGRDWIFTCLIRGWDDDSLASAGFWNTSSGASSGNAVIVEPGGLAVGSLLSGEAVKLLFAPHNTNHKGFVLYRALPNLQSSTRLNFSTRKDLSYIATFRCIRDASGRDLQVGQVEDLTL